MKILQFPDKILLQPSVEANLQDKKYVGWLIATLKDAYQKLPGNKAGLAAPQIGINKRAFISFGGIFLNPTFVPTDQIDFYEEGCYSVENGSKFFNVPRPKYGYATWTDENEVFHDSKLTGIDARVFQHELDHLNGVLCHQK